MDRSGGLAVFGTGLNAWLVLTAWPWLFDPRPGPLASAAAVLALVALAFGAACSKRHPERAMAAWLLGFPVLLGASLAALPPDNRAASLSSVPMALGVLGLWAHLATSAWVWQRMQPTTALPHGPLAAPVDAARTAPWADTAAAALLGVGAFAIGVLAPLWGEPAEAVTRWGEAAEEGALLTATVAAALGAAVAGPFLAAVLRPRTPHAPRPDLALKVASLVLLALLGAVSYRVL